jgi:hypothetical protein
LAVYKQKEAPHEKECDGEEPEIIYQEAEEKKSKEDNHNFFPSNLFIKKISDRFRPSLLEGGFYDEPNRHGSQYDAEPSGEKSRTRFMNGTIG